MTVKVNGTSALSSSSPAATSDEPPSTAARDRPGDPHLGLRIVDRNLDVAGQTVAQVDTGLLAIEADASPVDSTSTASTGGAEM